MAPVYSGVPEDAVLLADCYRNSLDLARKNGVRTIAFPAISTGVYGYSVGEATKVAVDTVLKWLADNSY